MFELCFTCISCMQHNVSNTGMEKFKFKEYSFNFTDAVKHIINNPEHHIEATIVEADEQ